MTTAAPHERSADGIAELLAELFLPRSSLRAKIRMRPEGGEPLTIPRPLTRRDIDQHVKGIVRFGPIPFMDDSHVGWGCIDLDATLWGHDPDDPEVFAIVNEIVETLAGFGIRAVLERSKGKGWHVWAFFDRPAPARDVRELLLRVALKAGAKEAADLVCPRGEQLEPEGTGNGTWLPLFGAIR